MTNHIENMKIVGTMLGYEGHGILTCALHLEGNGCSVSYGGYALDEYDRERKERVTSAASFQTIVGIIKMLGVRSWEEVPGQFVRAELGGLGKGCLRIGHLIQNKWFSFEDHFAKHR